MMLLDRESQRITHLRFRDFVDLVRPQELVVLNNTKVIPARIRFPDRNAEILLLEASRSVDLAMSCPAGQIVFRWDERFRSMAMWAEGRSNRR